MGKPLRVLIVEDSEDDALFIVRELVRGGYDPDFERVETAEAMLAALRNRSWDVVLCDYKLPQFSGPAAIDILKETGSDIPLIIVSGAIGEKTAVATMKAGAHDYVMKGNLARLVPAIEREIQEALDRGLRRQTEESLRQSEMRYRSLFDHSYDAIFLAEPTGVILDANPAACRMLDRTVEEIRRLGRAGIMDETDQRLIALLQERDCTGKTFAEVDMVRADGKKVPAELSSMIFRDDQGRLKTCTIVRDLTERKKAEEDIRAAEERYRQILNHMSNALAVYEPVHDGADFIVRDMNPAALNIENLRAEDILGQSVLDVFPGIKAFGLFDVLQRVWRTGESEYFPPQFYQDERIRGWRENYVYKLPTGEVVAVYEDVSARVEAESELRKAKEEWESIFQSIGHPTIILSPERGVLAANQAAVKLTGITADHIYGKPCYEIFHPDLQTPPPGCPLEILSTAEQDSEMDIEARGRFFHVHCSPVFDEAGNLEKVIHVMTDVTERKRAEDILREKQRSLEDAYRLAHLGIWTWIQETETLTWSPEIYGMFGLDPRLPPPSVEEHRRLYPSGGWKARMAANKRVLETGESYRLEHEIFYSDGTRRWIDSLGGPKYDADGRIIGLQGTVQDITERKKAQDVQRKEKDWKNLMFWLYGEAQDLADKEIFDQILERVVELTESKIGFFHQISGDEQTVILTSWDRETLKNCTASYETHYPAEQAGNWLDSFRLRKPVIYNDFPQSPNQKGLPEGHVPVRRFMSIPVVDGDVRVIFGVGNKEDAYDEFDLVQVQLLANNLQRVISQRRGEEALRLSEEKYRSIYDNATEGIFQTTPAGRILSANRALAWMMGYDTPEELLADVRDIAGQLYVHPEKRQMMMNIMDKQGFVADFEFQAYRKGGGKMWVFMNAHVVKDDQGNILYYEGTMTDVTRRKEAEEQLRQAYIVLRETSEQLMQADKLAAVGTLAAGVAHEILNPLNIIAMGIAALKSTQKLSDPVQEAFDIFDRQIERVVRITRDLQKFSRKSEGRMELTDLREVIESTLTLCAPRLKVEGIAPVVAIDDECPVITMDRQRMEQVFLNIINNAIDAMAGKERRELRIATKMPSGPGISLKRVVVSISDRGHGIDEKIMDHLFNPFFTTKAPDKGTGLGLSISHTIVQSHGGRIWAENNPDGGATFFIELPVNQD